MVPPLSDARFEETIAATGKALDVAMEAFDQVWSDGRELSRKGRVFARSVGRAAKAMRDFHLTVQGLKQKAASLDRQEGSGTASPVVRSESSGFWSGPRSGGW
jgi:hypothetical protein